MQFFNLNENTFLVTWNQNLDSDLTKLLTLYRNIIMSICGDDIQDCVQSIRSQGCFPKEQLTPNELLPQDNSTAWAQVNPQGAGTLKDKNFLQAAHHIGINTVGQSLRNANLQLRSEPANPQLNVGPWNQTTIAPDMQRRPLEIGCGNQ